MTVSATVVTFCLQYFLYLFSIFTILCVLYYMCSINVLPTYLWGMFFSNCIKTMYCTNIYMWVNGCRISCHYIINNFQNLAINLNMCTLAEISTLVKLLTLTQEGISITRSNRLVESLSSQYEKEPMIGMIVYGKS